MFIVFILITSHAETTKASLEVNCGYGTARFPLEDHVIPTIAWVDAMAVARALPTEFLWACIEKSFGNMSRDDDLGEGVPIPEPRIS